MTARVDHDLVIGEVVGISGGAATIKVRVRSVEQERLVAEPSSSVFPSVVIRSPSGVRSNRRSPSEVSSAASLRPHVGCVTLSGPAAADKLPARWMARKNRMSSQLRTRLRGSLLKRRGGTSRGGMPCTFA